MTKHNQNGAVNILLIPLILAVLFMVGAVGFAAWAYTSRASYKDQSDAKVSSAVELAKQQESTLKDQQFAEAEKQPYKTYTGPQPYGSLVVQYPKTWSGYVDDSNTGTNQVDGYFHPSVVPSLTSQSSLFALRVQIVNQSYPSVLTSFRGLQQASKIMINPYALPKVPSVIGVRIDGQIKTGKNGSMVVLPLRDKTLEVSTEGNDYGNDYNTILSNLTFTP